MTDKEKKTLGGRISELLKKTGMTQKRLAEAAGVTESTMSRYIRGDRVPKGTIIANIALALHTTTDYLLCQEAEDDSELVYYATQRAIARNVKNWSRKQKADLVNALFEAD